MPSPRFFSHKVQSGMNRPGVGCVATASRFLLSTPVLLQGLTWAFWTIVGNLDDKALNKLDSLTPVTR